MEKRGNLMKDSCDLDKVPFVGDVSDVAKLTRETCLLHDETWSHRFYKSQHLMYRHQSS